MCSNDNVLKPNRNRRISQRFGLISLSRKCLLASVLYLLLSTIMQPCFAKMTDEELAQRFRPYYKFTDGEDFHPCSWQFFLSRSDLIWEGGFPIVVVKNTNFASKTIAKNPQVLLKSFKNADIRTSANAVPSLRLRFDSKYYPGLPWSAVMRGNGLYAQVEHADNRTVVITYWTLFARNEVDTGAFIGGTILGGNPSHQGDLIAVNLVYDIPSDSLTRASFVAHGDSINSFNLANPAAETLVTLRGRRPNYNDIVDVAAKKIDIEKKNCYQTGPNRGWENYKPAARSVYFVQKEKGEPFEHIAIYLERNSHEPWPNQFGSYPFVPEHDGNGTSFLPSNVHFIGSISSAVPDRESLFYFNGKWGDPLSIAFHKTCFYKNGWNNGHFKIPKKSFIDLDPFHEGPLSWPPPLPK